jgi:flagellin-like hook-associated protein FlgL
MNRELEILAPAGNIEIFKTNIDAGADAIYFGGEKFGARAYADNFSFEDAENALKYAHLRGRKAYLTVNTLLKNVEIERELYDYIKTYYEMGLDAVIVQDFGVFNFIKEAFPEISLHASTQMTIANKYGADYLEKCGADRIVTSREMSLDEIRDISLKTSVALSTVFAENSAGTITFNINKGKAEIYDKLTFSLHVGADADMTNKIGVDISAMTSKGLGIRGLNVTDDSGIAATYAIDAIADAVQKVSDQRSALGAIQNRLEHTIKNVDNVVENTTAAESRIRDTDMAEEMVTYSKNNILAQAGQSMLAQANQSNQGVLSLLG